MTPSRIFYLDVIRLLACAMVVLMHSPIPSTGDNNLILLVVSYGCAPSMGLFFMISGALLLPVREDARRFLSRRLGNVLAPTVVWTLFYIVVNRLDYDNIDMTSLVRQVLSIPFSPQGTGIMWFMYTIIGLYIIAPVISPWLENVKRSSLELYLGFWLLTTCFPLIDNILMINSGIEGSWYYISGYVGYFVMGYYLRRYGSHLSIWKLAIGFVVAWIAPVTAYFSGAEVDFYRMFWYLSIFVVTMSILWYRLVQTHGWDSCRFKGLIGKISRLSFGIYLTHIFIMRRWIWHWDLVNWIDNYCLQILIIFALTFAISLLATYAVSLLPFGKYIVGCSMRKGGDW